MSELQVALKATRSSFDIYVVSVLAPHRWTMIVPKVVKMIGNRRDCHCFRCSCIPYKEWIWNNGSYEH